MIVAITLFAALLLGAGFVLQQRAASRAPLEDVLRFRLLVRLIRSRQWLAGIAFMVGGQVLSAYVLSRASVTLIEPLLAVNLIVALLLAAAIRRRSPRRSDWVGALILGAGLAAFIVAGNPSTGNVRIGGVREWGAIAAIAVIAIALVAASRMRPLGEQATMLAGAAGCLAGLQDGFTRTAVITFRTNPGLFALDWHPYAVVGIGILVILLQQSAFRAGSLRQALPAVTAGEPLAGIAFGIVAFGDQVRTAPWALAVEAAGLAAMVVGVYIVATSALIAGIGDRDRQTDRHSGHRDHSAPGDGAR